jgi:hypothetical protein
VCYSVNTAEVKKQKGPWDDPPTPRLRRAGEATGQPSSAKATENQQAAGLRELNFEFFIVISGAAIYARPSTIVRRVQPK